MNNLILKNENNEDITINVIDIYEDNYYKKQYIFYTMVNEGNPEDIYASILDEKDETYALRGITDEKEWQYVNSILNNLPNRTL